MKDNIAALEEQAEPLDRLEKRLKLLERYKVRSYHDGKLTIELAGTATAPKKKPTEEQEGEPLLRG